MSDSHDELGDELKREWFGRRAQQIHDELKADFDRYIREMHRDRMNSILEASGHQDGDPADPIATSTANTISATDGVLVAVAMYLARREANTPEGS